MRYMNFVAGFKSRAWRVGVALVLLALAAGLWLVKRAPPVDSVQLSPTQLVRSVQFSARVATLTRVDVGSTLTGRVQAVQVREGALVKAGEVLVQMESEELQAALRQAQAQQQQAHARLQGLRSTGRTQVGAALQQAQAGVQAARADMHRTEQLVAQGFLSPARRDESRRTLDVALAAQDAAGAQVQAANDTGADLLQTQAQLAQARAATQVAQARLAQAMVRAPADARVLSRMVEPGQIVQPGRTLLSLALAGPTQLKAQVDERFLSQLQPGQRARVVADAFAAQILQAQVLAIAPAVDAQRGAVEVTLGLMQSAPDFLREDMTLSVEVETAQRDQALVLPLAALHNAADAADDVADVLLAVDGRAQLRRVRLGVRSQHQVEVLQGLNAGDEVLLGGTVEAGARVRTRVLSQQQSAARQAAMPAPNQAGAAGAALGNAMGR